MGLNGLGRPIGGVRDKRSAWLRLIGSGLKGIQIRHRAVCLHLDHDRGYATAEGIAFNRSLRDQTKQGRIIRTPYGIEQLDKT